MGIHLKPVEIVLLVAFGIASLLILLLCIACSSAAPASKKTRLEGMRKERRLPSFEDDWDTADGRPETPKKVERSERTSVSEPGRRSIRKTTFSMTPTDSGTFNASDTTIDSSITEAASMETSAAGTLNPASEQAMRSKVAGVLEPVPLLPDFPDPPMPRPQPQILVEDAEEEAEAEEEEEVTETPAHLRSELQTGSASQVLAVAAARRSSKAPTTPAGVRRSNTVPLTGAVQGVAVIGGLNCGSPLTCKDSVSPGRGSPQEAYSQGKPLQAWDLGTTRKPRKSWVPFPNEFEDVSWAEGQDEQDIKASMARRHSLPEVWTLQPRDNVEGRWGRRRTVPPGPTSIGGRLQRAALFSDWRQVSPSSQLGLCEAAGHKVLYPDPVTGSTESTATKVSIV